MREEMNDVIAVKRINRLDSTVSNKIAAGEVVERPAAVVKELVENAIDAGATQIFIDIENGGKSLIRITDNGCGITPEDLPLAFERHATSKVAVLDDLYHLVTLGFRGEALASIAAVSHVDLTTKRAVDDIGYHVHLTGGQLVHQAEVACQKGTTLMVKDLFFNTPARLKFLRSTAAETAAISDLVIRLAISHPEISFKYHVDQKQIFMTPGDNQLQKVLYAVLDKELSKHLISFEQESTGFKVSGFLSKLSYVRSNRSYQMFFVNGRFVRSRTLSDAIANAYLGLLPIGKFPSAVVFLTLPPDLVDVNIHPAKTEIKFENEYKIRDQIADLLRSVIHTQTHTPELPLRVSAVFSEPSEKNPKPEPHTTAMSQQRPAERIIEETGEYSAVIEEKMANPIPEKFNKAIFEHLKLEDIVAVEPNALPVNGEQAAMTTTESIVPELEPVVIEQQSFMPKVAESLYDGLTYIGQIFNSYLLFERDQKLMMIDQHAGHEKCLYEQLKTDFKRGGTIRQILVKPLLVEMDHGELHRLLDAVEDFERLGFSIEAFGTDSLVVREVPMAFSIPVAEDFFKEVIGLMDQKRLSAPDLWLEKIIKSACKGAIKANDRLTELEVKRLLETLKTLESPYTCPHGRPIIVSVSRLEIERMFKRT